MTYFFSQSFNTIDSVAASDSPLRMAKSLNCLAGFTPAFLLILGLAVATFSHLAMADANITDKGNSNAHQTSLFLPVVSATYPNLDTKLTSALRQQGVHELTVKNVDFWHPYQQGLKEGRREIYFAQPHFAAWAINQHDFTPLFKLHGSLKYVLVARRSDTDVFEINDLDGKTICREAGLNLGTVWLNRLLGENRLNTRIKERASIAPEMQKVTSTCSAFVIDDFSYERLNKKSANQFIRLKQSEIFKHYAFVSHPSIDTALIERLKKALKAKKIARLLRPYFSSLSKWQNLLPVKPGDYHNDDFNMLKTYWKEPQTQP